MTAELLKGLAASSSFAAPPPPREEEDAAVPVLPDEDTCIVCLPFVFILSVCRDEIALPWTGISLANILSFLASESLLFVHPSMTA